MKNKKKFISIFILMISMLACCFVFANNRTIESYAAEITHQDCYNLLDGQGGSYEANTAVGKIDGLGKFVVGEENVTLTATANDNFQLVGWQVIYSEQNDKSIFIDDSNLESYKKDIELVAKDGVTKIIATVEFIQKDNIYNKGTFKLSRVFENLIVRPVFNHVYYSIDVTELTEISTLNSKNIGEDILFYETLTENGEVIEYANAYIKIGTKHFFYGNLNEKNGKYYTLHKQTTQQGDLQEVEYTAGAFRVGETVEMSFKVDIKEDNLKESKNIDFVGASVIGGSSVSLSKDAAANGYTIQQDGFLRTTEYSINFNVLASSNQTNVVDIVYHNLYVVDLQIEIDGELNHDETTDVFGNVKVESNNVLSNISIYNFYSRTNDDNLQFLIKKAQDNASRPFTVVAVENITKTIEGVNYGYYTFASLDGSTNPSQTYANINQNITINIEYSSALYQIAFEAVEYVNDEQNVILHPFTSTVLDPIYKKRGEKVELNLESAKDINNVGYKFVGYALSLDSAVAEQVEYSVDANKPLGATIYMCFEKISYNVVFTNYNKLKIGETYPLRSVTFTIVNGQNQSAQTLLSSDLIGDGSISSIQLENQLKINGILTVDKEFNNGFNILGFSAKAPDAVSENDYFTTLNFDAEFIEENNIEDSVYVYVYEAKIEYSLTYYTPLTHDTSLDENVIMANLSANSTTGKIERYDINDALIADGDVDTVVAKIVVSKLNLDDEVVLSSVGIVAGEGENSYSYVFNWFTEDDKATLSYVKTGDVYAHTEKVFKNREIKVVYSMPSTKLMITVDEEFANNENFTLDFSVSVGGNNLDPIDGLTNVFSMDVGATVTVTVSNIAFGYNFVGYTNIETNTNFSVDGLTFNYVTDMGINTVQLEFERIKYHFIFRQYGGGKNGDIVSFSGQTYIALDIDNTSAKILKPLGYYVSNVKFNETHDEYAEKLGENNGYRLNGDISTYNFEIERADFVDVISNYGVLNADSVAEINVRLDYSIFEYQIKVFYGLVNPKGDSRDQLVTYPEIKLTYSVGGGAPINANVEFLNSENGVAFVGIPYGAQATMSLMGGSTLGLSLSGWAYLDGTRVGEEYANSFESLTVNNLVQDKSFKYLLSYVAYRIQVQYEQGQGNPEVYINNVLTTSPVKQITLYDKLSIVANASRNNGYVFDKITYAKPVYTEFVYSSEMWDLKHAELYVKKGDSYVLNTNNVYDENAKYYFYSTEEQICEMEMFETDSFVIAQFALEKNGQTILFNVHYKLLQLSIVNTVQESEEILNNLGWTLQDIGNGDAKIQIDLAEMARFEMSATAKDGTVRVVDEDTTVNYFDTITINININSAALNYDLTEYNLTLGLKLVDIYIGQDTMAFEDLGEGRYKLSFSVGDYLPAVDEIIDILYTLEVQSKNIKVTTIVKESKTFYENTKLVVNAFAYGFSSEVVDTAYKTNKLSHNLQFLAKTNIYATFKTNDYKDNFIVSGVTIKCDGELISQAEYAQYGIYVDKDNMVIARLLRDIEVEFIVQPKITYNGGPVYSKTFICDSLGYGLAQKLTVGSGSSDDIQIAEMLAGGVSISYLSTEPNSIEQSEVVNAGRYNVLITFEDVEGFDWLDEVSVAENVTLIIQQKELSVTYDWETIVTDSKVYDGTSNYNVEKIYKYLIFTDNNTFTVYYADIMNAVDNNLTITAAKCYIALDGTEISKANENVFYDLYVYDIKFRETQFNKNFIFKTPDLTIPSYIKIMRRELKLQNVQVYSKVYDGTDKAELVATDNIVISNAIVGDDIAINILKLNPRFKDSSIGTDKKVIIDATNALIGADVNNYIIKTVETKGLTIYPYSLSVNIRGVGKVEVVNKRGLTEKDKVELIPLNATLKVSVIHPDTQEYVAIHSKISKHIKGNNEFAIGYQIAFIINGEEFAVDNDLYLSIPVVKNLTGSYFLTGQNSGKVQVEYENGTILIDLSQIDENINQLFMTRTKILLKAWQIVLIIVGALLIIAVIVLILIIVRKRKVDRDSVHEKI